MPDLAHLLERNRAWAAGRIAGDARFFERLCEIQQPEYLWIGCSDSRVPANEIVGLAPGDLFVHRNVANLVAAGDPNGMAVVQYAVEVLNVRSIIVCGHYGCGGVQAVLEGSLSQAGSHVERWLAPLRSLANARSAPLGGIADFEARCAALCEMNVAEQVRSLLSSDVLINAGLRGMRTFVHGWIYNLRDGLLHDLGVSQSVSDRTTALSFG
jgi:carbonic anhydrase